MPVDIHKVEEQTFAYSLLLAGNLEYAGVKSVKSCLVF